MAIQDQGQGQLQEITGVVKRRAVQIVLPAMFFCALGISLARLLPRKYTTKTGLELREHSLPITGEGFDSHALQRDVNSTSWQIKQVERVRRVVEKLEWPDYTALTPPKQHEYIKHVIENLVAVVQAPKTGMGSSLIEVTYTDSDPQRAEQFLNRLRDAYTTEVLERYRDDARKALDIFANRRTLALAKYVQADRDAADIKKRNQVSATQQAPGGGRQRDEDPVFLQLNAAKTHLDNVETQIATLEAALAALKQQYADTPREISRSELREGVTFDDQLDQLDAEIETERERQKGLRPPNSVYIDAESKIEKYQEKKAQLLARSSKPLAEVGMVHNPRRDELDAEIQDKDLELRQAQGLKVKLTADVANLTQEQEKRVEVFREIQKLDNDAMIAAQTYAAATATFEKQKGIVDLITLSQFNPFELTELARTPLKPTSPNEPLVILGGLVLGLAVGLLSAFTAEFGHSAFRGVADISRTLSVPVLGVVNRIVTQREEARERVRRVAVVASTCALIGALLWVTWAFENRPRLLGSELTQSIESFREVFR